MTWREGDVTFDARAVLSYAGVSSFKPKMPATIKPMHSRRNAPDGSPSRIMPAIAVPTVPMPTQTSLSEDGSADVRRILAELPDWLPNTVRQLNQLGAPLVKSGMKKGNKPLHELFRKYPAYFKVLPMTGAPKQVRLLKKPGR